MANSVYISINITPEQLQFMKWLDEYEIEIFSLEKIEDQLNKKIPDLNEILENLVHKEVLSRIERGKFCKTNFRNEKVIGTFIAKESAVAYWSALNLHGLTEQFPNSIFIQTTQNKENKSVFGTSYKFVKIRPSKRYGISWSGYGNLKYPITDIEKTIVDCFDLPQHSGGYAELLRAFGKADLSSAKLIEYCKELGNISVIRRLGFLAELLNKKGMKSFIQFAKNHANKSYNNFDPLGQNIGEYNNEWHLRLNINYDTISSITHQEY